MKQREGDQPLPKVNESLDCQETLLYRLATDIPARREVGIKRYGTGLQPLNGRDVARDAYEEWLDLGTYMEQWRRERADLIDFLHAVVTDYRDVTPSGIVQLAEGLLDGMGIKR